MRAIVIHEYGAPDVLRLEEVPEPVAGAGEALIEVAAIGTIYSETQVRAGVMARFGLAEHPLPHVFGRDVAGTIVSVGPGVEASVVGMRVIASTTGTGGYAERVVIPASFASKSSGAVFSSVNEIPAGLDFERAAALLGQGRAALGLIKEAPPHKGDTVLITAAAGGLGTLLIQLARHAGAGTIVAAASGQAKLGVMKDLGADLAVDYDNPEWGDHVRAETGGVNLIFDAVGGEVARTAVNTGEDGNCCVVIYGLSSGSLIDIPTAELLRRGLTIVGYSGARLSRRPEYVRELQGEILRMAADGVIRPVIGQRFPLADAAAAHAAIEARQTVGKTLLIP